MNGYAHVFIVFCPIEAGYNDTCTDENTAEQSNQQEDDTSWRADSSESIFAKKITNNQRIYYII